MKCLWMSFKSKDVMSHTTQKYLRNKKPSARSMAALYSLALTLFRWSLGFVLWEWMKATAPRALSFGTPSMESLRSFRCYSWHIWHDTNSGSIIRRGGQSERPTDLRQLSSSGLFGRGSFSLRTQTSKSAKIILKIFSGWPATSLYCSTSDHFALT